MGHQNLSTGLFVEARHRHIELSDISKYYTDCFKATGIPKNKKSKGRV